MFGKKIRHTLAVLALLGAILMADAQNASRSPYSMFGFGEMVHPDFINDRLLGNAGVVRSGINTFSVVNPASYGAIKYTLFDGGGKIDLGHMEAAGKRNEFSNAAFNHFAFAFPLKEEKVGMSFGLLPFSHRGYDLLSQGDTGVDAYEASFYGKGDISRAYLGLGFSPFKGFTAGANINALFGYFQDVTVFDYSQTTDRFGVYDQTNMSFRGVSVDVGVQYGVQHKKAWFQRFGWSAQLPFAMNASRDRLVQNFNHPDFSSNPGQLAYDTVFFQKGQTEGISLPLQWQAGYAFGKQDKWQLSLSYHGAKFSSIESAFLQGAWADVQRLGAGFWIVPMDAKDMKVPYFGRVRYSLGVRSELRPWVYKGTQVSERGMTIGFGLPVSRTVTLTGGKENLTSYLNIGVEYIQRGVPEGLNESFFRLHFGFTFCDKWFIKRKYL